MQLNDTNTKRARKLSLTPLIDVVFLLLIFFMLASTFTTFKTLPLAVGGSTNAAGDLKKIMLLRIREAEALELNGQVMQAEEIRAALKAHAETAEAKLIIRPATGTSVQTLVTVMDMARHAGITATTILR